MADNESKQEKKRRQARERRQRADSQQTPEKKEIRREKERKRIASKRLSPAQIKDMPKKTTKQIKHLQPVPQTSDDILPEKIQDIPKKATKKTKHLEPVHETLHDSLPQPIQHIPRKATKKTKHLEPVVETLYDISPDEYESQTPICFAHSPLLKSLAVEVHSCGDMTTQCQFCEAYYFKQERPRDGQFISCCQKGKFKLPERKEFPIYLQNIMTEPTFPNYKNFKTNIRSYNSAISFASMGATLAANVPGHGPYCFKVQGQIYHRTSHLHPEEGEQRKFAQLYVLDTMEAVDQRMQMEENKKCLHSVFIELNNIMDKNPYSKAYKKLAEVENEQLLHAQRHQLPMPKVNMVLKRDRHTDKRRYNLPTSNEVAMVFQNEEGEPPFQRDIRIYPRNEEQPFINMSILSPNLDPMTYPIFFPHGEAGWQPKLTLPSYPNAKARIRNNVSMLEFKVAQIAIRNTFNPILCGGKLTQQWIIDSYLQVEANNLNFIKYQQDKLRVEQYSGLMDYVAEVATSRDMRAGKAIILPSSFQGSPRNMRERYNDAMAIVTKFGKPDLFLTFTCNPQWPEITQNLLLGQSPSDRPDLVARVFKIKLNELIRDITISHLFGKCLAYVYTIEFKKRGLPHAHLLIILQEKDKLDTADKVDAVIVAELPDPELYGRLYEIVTHRMIHGPCGELNPQSPCMENNKCSKDFPKDYRDKTYANCDGYPLYKRREGDSAIIRGKKVDNRYVVPYNPHLLMKYNAHINVEACTSIKSIKYVYKYIYKGYDAATVVVKSADNPESSELVHDELASHVDARYVSAPEAMWRLLKFEMHDRSHAVYRLAVHLPQRHLVYFHAGNEMNALAQSEDRHTTLTAWFELNSTDSEATEYLYIEIPYHYVFVNGLWRPRKSRGNKIIPRIYTVSPRDVERFCLRILLLNVPGAQSFEHLRTVNDIVYESFHLAARHRNLLADDTEWERCLEEAAQCQMPRQMREQFAFICIFANAPNALALWETFKSNMAEDFMRRYNEPIAHLKALMEIQEVFVTHGLSCASFNLPDPGLIDDINFEDYDIQLQAERTEERLATLNTLQLQAFHAIQNAIQDDMVTERYFYLDGPGGSGKTYLYNLLMSSVRAQGEIAMAFATTGIAALLLEGGRTVHSGFKLPVPILETSVSDIRMTSLQAKKLKKCKLIIIDEATMMSCYALQCIDRLLREVMDNTFPFGGKVMLLGGDFRQTLPVVVHGNRTDIIETCIKSSTLWKHFTHLQLQQNMRSEGQTDFNDWLIKIGEGRTEKITHLPDDTVEIPPQMICQQDIISAIFEGSINNQEYSELANQVILTCKNKDALILNNDILKKINAPQRNYHSADSVLADDNESQANFSTEFINSLTPSGMPPHILQLKKGAIIMLLRNMNPKKGLCNGTRLIVQQLKDHFIDAEILTGTHKGERVFIPRIDLAPSESSLPFILQRRQFPIIMAFAMTINKSQGQTFKSVGIFLEEPVFAHGQLYVALSRCKNPQAIKIYIEKNESQGDLLEDGRIFTKNIVYYEVL